MTKFKIKDMKTRTWNRTKNRPYIKTFIMLQKVSVSDECCSSELSIHQRNLKKLYSAVFNIIIIIILIIIIIIKNVMMLKIQL